MPVCPAPTAPCSPWLGGGAVLSSRMGRDGVCVLVCVRTWTCLITTLLVPVASFPFNLCTIFLSFLFLSRHMFSPDPQSHTSIFTTERLENTDKPRESSRSLLLIPFPEAGPRPQGRTVAPAPLPLPPLSHTPCPSRPVLLSLVGLRAPLCLFPSVPLSLGACLCLQGLCFPHGGRYLPHPRSFIHEAGPGDAPESVCLWDGRSPPTAQVSWNFTPSLCELGGREACRARVHVSGSLTPICLTVCVPPPSLHSLVKFPSRSCPVLCVRSRMCVAPSAGSRLSHFLSVVSSQLVLPVSPLVTPIHKFFCSFKK